MLYKGHGIKSFLGRQLVEYLESLFGTNVWLFQFKKDDCYDNDVVSQYERKIWTKYKIFQLFSVKIKLYLENIDSMTCSFCHARVLLKIFISSFSTSFTSNYILRLLIVQHEFGIFIFFCSIWAKCNHLEMNYKCIYYNLTCFLSARCLAHSILKLFSKLFILLILKLNFLWENCYATIKIMLLSFTCFSFCLGKIPLCFSFLLVFPLSYTWYNFCEVMHF